MKILCGKPVSLPPPRLHLALRSMSIGAPTSQPLHHPPPISSVEPQTPSDCCHINVPFSRVAPFHPTVLQDAFNKLREQIIICHKQPREHRGGLNMINNTNLEFFNSKQKAELFRLKGVFLTSLGAKQEANNAYSHAVQVSSSCFRCCCSLAVLVLKTVLGRLFGSSTRPSLFCTRLPCPTSTS